MATSAYNSAAGILSLLDENDHDVQEMALKKLETLVNQYWAEISESIRKIEGFYENQKFPNRELAALLTSKVYYHLNEFDESLQFALGAGKLFDVSKQDEDEYVNKIIGKCIDTYIRVRQSGQKEDPRLTDIVERMFDKCFQEGEYKQALGIALESRRLDKLEQAIKLSPNVREMLNYTFDIAMNLIQIRDFRHSVLKSLVEIYKQSDKIDYFAVTQCLTFLDDAKAVGDILYQLVTSEDTDKIVIAYQIGFDLHDRAPQHFLVTARQALLSDQKSQQKDNPISNLLNILSGEITIEHNVDFLFRHNHTDIQILNNIKSSFERNSILHSGTITANAYMHAGTTVDKFLRDNLEWLGKASNWSKFSATASLGVIHRGQIKDSLTILKPYLPSEGASTTGANAASVFSEGGALFGLGIIHSNHLANDMTEYLLKVVGNQQTDPVTQHGACFGLGLCGMATEDAQLYEKLKDILFLDNAVSGEAAAIGMGLVMLGSGSDKAINEMLNYAHETAHEKIIRGLALGMALCMYGREEEANTLIETLSNDKDPLLRYGGMYMYGLAYAGTGNNSVTRKLLQIAVSDVSDDVRRAAVINLGFLLFKTPKQCPRIVSLLAESYNPHVRYGVALAVGISCAGTGLKEALDLLEPLAKDRVDFVRQGSLIAQSMVLMQLNETQEPKVADFRKHLQKTWSTRTEEVMSKLGSVLAAGILDAGGRNVTIALHRHGNNKMRNIVGLALFTQYWFWYPYLHFLSLSFDPTAIIGLNSELKMPSKFTFKSNQKPSFFAYPSPMKMEEEKKEVTLGPVAELSLTAKARVREERKRRRQEGSATPLTTPLTATPTPQQKEEKQEKDKEKKKKKKEPNFENLTNPARVTPSQLSYLSFDTNARYIPIKLSLESSAPIDLGINVLRDTRPGEDDEFVTKQTGSIEEKEEELEEPNPPASFQWP
ncbi:hypothetical protein ABK040_009347 [Willaertia magna]